MAAEIEWLLYTSLLELLIGNFIPRAGRAPPRSQGFRWELTEGGTMSLTPRDRYAARLLDLFDILRSAHRLAQ